MPRRIVVTGCAGRLGSMLTRGLLKHPLVRRVAGLDVRTPPPTPDPRFAYLPADVRDEPFLRSILEEEEADTVFHLAFPAHEARGTVEGRSTAVTGGVAVLDAAHRSSRVSKLVLASSAFAYGARSGNRPFLKEDHPLRARPSEWGGWHREFELEVARLLPEIRPSLQVCILRLAPVLDAAGGGGGPLRGWLDSTLGLTLLRDCPLQFLSEADLERVFLKILEAPEARGVFNVAPDDATTVKTVVRRLKSRRLALPYPLAWAAAAAAGRWRPESGLDGGLAAALAFPVVLDNAKIKRVLGARFDTSSEEALASRPARTMTPPRAIC